MWSASLWPFVFQTAKEALVEGKQSATADAEIGFPEFHGSAWCSAFLALLFCFFFNKLLIWSCLWCRKLISLIFSTKHQTARAEIKYLDYHIISPSLTQIAGLVERLAHHTITLAQHTITPSLWTDSQQFVLLRLLSVKEFHKCQSTLPIWH